jgi:hypothetical protein
MDLFLTIVAILGALVTLVACVRMLIALKRNEPRDTVMGWFAIMVIAPLVVFGLDRVMSGLT